MFNFKKYYTFPLRPMLGLERFKVVTSDHRMAFDWTWEFANEYRLSIIKALNEEEEFPNLSSSRYFYKDGIVYVDLGKERENFTVLKIRGWGMLTDYPFHLSKEEAKQIQDEFGEFICKQLNI